MQLFSNNSPWGNPIFGFAIALLLSRRRATVRAAKVLLLLSVVAVNCGSAPIVRDRDSDNGNVREGIDVSTSPSQWEAVKAVRRGDADSALKALRSEASGNPAAPLPEVALAGILRDEGQPEQGRMMLEQAVVVYPDDPEPHLALADLAWRERRLSDAHLQYDRAKLLAEAMSANPPRKARLVVWALGGLGSVAETRGQQQKALGLFNQLLKHDAAHSQAHYRLGHILFSMGREEEAYNHLAAAVESSPAAPPALLAMATLFQRAGDLDRAQQWIDRAVAEAPDSVTPKLTRARFDLDVRNDPESAQATLAQASELAPNNQEVRLLSALTAWRLGNLQQAETVLESLALEQPDAIEVQAYLASVLAEQETAEQVQRAQEIATLNSSSHPNSVIAASAYGWVMLHAGKVDLASKQLDATTKVAAASRDTHYYYARALFRAGKTSAAKEQLATALNSSGPFIHLQAARKWGEELGLSDSH